MSIHAAFDDRVPQRFVHSSRGTEFAARALLWLKDAEKLKQFFERSGGHISEQIWRRVHFSGSGQ